MIQSDTVSSVLSIFSLSSIVVLISGGIAWGKLNARVNSLEKWVKTIADADFITRPEFMLMTKSLDNIQEDVREIRKRMP